MLNKVQLIGFTGAEAEIRTTSGGKKVATLRVATSRYTKKGGDRKDYTTWHQVEIWNQGTVTWLASRGLPKGSKVRRGRDPSRPLHRQQRPGAVLLEGGRGHAAA